MNRFINLIQSIVSDMKLLGKPFIYYTLAYIGLAVFPNITARLSDSNTTVNFILTLLTFTVAVFQMIAVIYFQREYIKQQIGNVVFNSIFAVILHLYVIYFIQSIIMIIPVAAVMIIFNAAKSNSAAVSSVLGWIGKGLIFILILYWLSRLVFVPAILVYKKESMRMKHIIAESKAIFRENFFIVQPFFLAVCILGSYIGFTVVDNPDYTPSLVLTVFLTCNTYVSSILYCKVVINYQLKMARRYLSDVTGVSE